MMASARRLLSPAIFRDEPHRDTIIIPVRDDRFAPVLRCGEFAVIDQREAWLEIGALYWVRYADGNSAFLALGEPKETRNDRRKSGLSFSVNYGLAHIQTLDGRAIPEFLGCCMGDILTEKHLKTLIVGRVIGVLGDGERALTWQIARDIA